MNCLEVEKKSLPCAADALICFVQFNIFLRSLRQSQSTLFIHQWSSLSTRIGKKVSQLCVRLQTILEVSRLHIRERSFVAEFMARKSRRKESVFGTSTVIWVIAIRRWAKKGQIELSSHSLSFFFSAMSPPEKVKMGCDLVRSSRRIQMRNW